MAQYSYMLMAAMQGDLDALSRMNSTQIKEARWLPDQTIVHVAAKNGQAVVILWLLKNVAGIDTNVGDAYARTPLHLAAQSGSLAAVELLFAGSSGSGSHKMKVADAKGRTALHAAASQGHLEIVNYLLTGLTEQATHMSLSVVDKQGRTALHLAALNGHAMVVNLLATKSTPNTLFCQDAVGFNFLHLAALEGHADALLEFGEWIDDHHSLSSSKGFTVLHLLCYRGRLRLAKRLLSRCRTMREAIDCATVSGKQTPLHVAADRDDCNANMIQLLLRSGARTNPRDAVGRTPLHYVARRGLQAGTKIILGKLMEEPCFNVDETDMFGLSPLHLAAANDHIKVVGVLLKYGADPNLEAKAHPYLSGFDIINSLSIPGPQDPNQEAPGLGLSLLHRPSFGCSSIESGPSTPLDLAVANGHKQVQKLLLQYQPVAPLGLTKSANSNQLSPTESGNEIKTEHRSSPLTSSSSSLRRLPSSYPSSLDTEEECAFQRTLRASEQERSENSRQRTINSSILDGYSTYFHLAAALGNEGYIKEKLVCNRWMRWEVNTTDAVGNTMLHIATHYGHIGIVALLLSQEAIDVNATNNRGMSAFHLAAEKGNASILRMLLAHPQVDAMAENKDKITGFVLAYNNGYLGACREILKSGKCNGGELGWLLRRSIRDEWFEMAALLSSEEGIPATEESKAEGLSALDLAMKYPNRRRFVLLLLRRKDVRKKLVEERRCFIELANAILVGAALIASVTYQAWANPPHAQADVLAARLFFWLNGFSFYLAISTLVAAAIAALPSPHIEPASDLRKAKISTVCACVLLAASVLCVMGAFAGAGSMDKETHYDTSFAAKLTSGFGVCLCCPLLVWFAACLVRFVRPKTLWQKILRDYQQIKAKEESNSSDSPRQNYPPASNEKVPIPQRCLPDLPYTATGRSQVSTISNIDNKVLQFSARMAVPTPCSSTFLLGNCEKTFGFTPTVLSASGSVVPCRASA